MLLPVASSGFRADQPPELRLVQQRDPMALLAQPFDLHQFDPTVPAPGLQRVRPAAGDYRRLRRRAAVDHGAGALRGTNRLAAFPAQDAGERDVGAFERAQHAGGEDSGWVPQRVDHFVRALVALASLADAAIDDLLEVIGAAE